MTGEARGGPETLGGFAARAFANRSFVAGFAITSLIAATALLSFAWTPYDVTDLVVTDRMLPPSAAHWAGTDHLGRDIMSMAVFGPGAVNAIIAIGIFNIPVFARVARAGAMALWPREFIMAARAAGKNKALITLEHILPNIATLLLVQGTIQFALGILAESGLS